MDRVDELLRELTPGGVPLRSLGDWVQIAVARVEPSKLDASSYVGVDNLLPNFGGRRDAKYAANSGGAVRYEPGDVLVGNIRPYLNKVWLADRVGGASPDVVVLSVKPERRAALLPGFLYFLVASDAFTAYVMRHAKGTKMPRGDKSAMLKYKVAVPPPEAQREIVSILERYTDIETELETQLQAELLCRIRQHEWYRQERLAQVEASLNWVTLPDVSTNRDGQRRPVAKLARIPGNIPYFGASGVVDHVSDHIFDGQFLLVSEDGANLLSRTTPIAFSISGKAWVNNHAHVLQFDSDVDRRFVEFYVNSIDLAPYISSGAQPKLSQTNLNRIRIPWPSKLDRERAVNVFERWDTLLNELDLGLRAELAARRKQYDYYRDKLLTFEEAAA